MEEFLEGLRTFKCPSPNPSEFIQTPVFSDAMRRAISESCKGRIPANKGISHSEETKKKISIANTGKTSYWKGKKLPKDSIAKMKQNLPNRKGDSNPRSREYIITFMDGRTEYVKSLQTWAIANGYVPTSVRNLYNGRQVTPHKNIIAVTPL